MSWARVLLLLPLLVAEGVSLKFSTSSPSPSWRWTQVLDRALAERPQATANAAAAAVDVNIQLFSPREKQVITAAGNLQRIISTRYCSPVTLDITRCEEFKPGVFHRDVVMRVGNVEFCRASSVVVANGQQAQRLVSQKQEGIGQMFEKLGARPQFSLHDAGKVPNGGLWRVYSLQTNLLECTICETFAPNLFDL